MAMTMTDIQQFEASIQPVDARGNPAPVENIVWAVSDTNLLEVTPATDGLSAVVKAVGPLGAGQLTVSCDAVIGDGLAELGGTLAVTVIHSQATGIAINAGAPTNQAV